MNDRSSTINKQQQPDLMEILKEDYEKFPEDQTFGIYADDVYFKDPLNEFNGIKKYQAMIAFLGSFFSDVEMEVHNVDQEGEVIKTEWTLNMTSPLPWKPHLSIPGWSELKVNDENLISSHIDYWHISPWKVLRQNFFYSQKASQ